jgi:PrcB C-terminal/Antistasin family
MRPSPIPVKRLPIGFVVLSFSVPLVLGYAGCSPQDIEEFLGAARDSTSPPSGAAIPFEEFNDEVGVHGATETRVLIRSKQGYQDFFGHAPPPGVDLASQWVIFYAAGTKGSGGYDANILSLNRSGKQLAAVTQLVSPGADCVVTLALTAPHVLIKFAAQPGSTADFSKIDSVKDCGSTTSACATILCAPGTHCEPQPVQCLKAPCPTNGVCVPDAPVVRCGGFGGFPCPGSGKCVDDPTDSCDPAAGGADCGGVCRCVQNVLCIQGAVFDATPKVCACVPQTPPPPVDDPCATVRCAAGTHCEAQAVMCVRAPCPPIAACVPDAPVVHCGGIAGIQCPGGGKCADDPNDGCDPNAGGADCGGVCRCVQNVACVRGAVFDSSPKVCACVPPIPPTMCGPVCDIFCAYGNVLDANGCPTCRCNTAPPQPAACPPEKCPGPAPKSVNFICPDGRTVAGPACVLDAAAGTCGWTIVACPAS